MSIGRMDALDLKLTLQQGSSLKLGALEIKPYRLEEIVAIGYLRYMENIQWISITKDDFIASVADAEKREFIEEQREKLRTYDFYTKLGGQEMLEGLVEALAMVFRTDDIHILDNGMIALDLKEMGIFVADENGNWAIDEEKLNTVSEQDLKLVHRDNFDDIVEIVKLQNFLKKPTEAKEANPVDEATRKLMERMKKNEERIQKMKKQSQPDDEDDIDISDIISAVSSKSYSINELNVWQLTLYQLYQKYSRLEVIDNYDFSVKAMMAGAEKVDLKHWSSKL